MKYSNYILASLLVSTLIVAPMTMASPVKFEFTQGGFYSYTFDEQGNLVQGAMTDASISGFFTGKDLDGDGQLYARGQLAVDFGYGPFGNELLAAQVTFDGFGTTSGPQTVVYDSNGIDGFGGPSDMTSLFSAFMGIAYNLDGGALGDTADEGLSLSLFAPSTNYTVGSVFAPYWSDPDYLKSEVTGICDNINACGVVFEAVPSPTQSGAAALTPFFLSTQSLQMTQVPVPAPTLYGLFAGLMGGLFMLRQIRKA